MKKKDIDILKSKEVKNEVEDPYGIQSIDNETVICK